MKVVQAIIGEFRSRFPEVPIVLTSIFTRDQNPEQAGVIIDTNRKLKAISQPDERVCWIDINDHCYTR